MRKLEGVVKEIVDELDYLKKREERFQSTNGMDVLTCIVCCSELLFSKHHQCQQTAASRISRGSLYSLLLAWACGRYSIYGHSSSANISLIETL